MELTYEGRLAISDLAMAYMLQEVSYKNMMNANFWLNVIYKEVRV